jgi:uncharacterized coiled-coil DUF342 family protein
MSLITINVQGNFDDLEKKLDKIFSSIKLIHKEMAQTQEQWEAVLTRIDTATTNIANQLRDLKEQLENQGLPADVEQQVFSRLETAANQLEQVGASPENPVPPTPEEPA